ncbi:MAG: copper chaperone [Planctomycetaceae bacterium]|nr:MAG: copper chaperone [Planctomycetaceae bacterium]
MNQRLKIRTLFASGACLLLVFCLVTASGCGSQEDSPAQSATPIIPAGQTVSLSVPTMHCEAGCFSKIKEELEKHTGVAEVTLAEQASEDRLDNRVVYVLTDAPFESADAIAALDGLGFPKVSVQR